MGNLLPPSKFIGLHLGDLHLFRIEEVADAEERRWECGSLRWGDLIPLSVYPATAQGGWRNAGAHGVGNFILQCLPGATGGPGLEAKRNLRARMWIIAKDNYWSECPSLSDASFSRTSAIYSAFPGKITMHTGTSGKAANKEEWLPRQKSVFRNVNIGRSVCRRSAKQYY